MTSLLSPTTHSFASARSSTSSSSSRRKSVDSPSATQLAAALALSGYTSGFLYSGTPSGSPRSSSRRTRIRSSLPNTSSPVAVLGELATPAVSGVGGPSSAPHLLDEPSSSSQGGLSAFFRLKARSNSPRSKNIPAVVAARKQPLMLRASTEVLPGLVPVRHDRSGPPTRSHSPAPSMRRSSLRSIPPAPHHPPPSMALPSIPGMRSAPSEHAGREVEDEDEGDEAVEMENRIRRRQDALRALEGRR